MDDAGPSISPFDSVQSPGNEQGVDSDHLLGNLGEMIDNGNNVNDDDLLHVEEPSLNYDPDSASAFDDESCSLNGILTKWPTEIANCLIPPISSRSGNPYNKCPAFYPSQMKGPLLVTLMSIFAVLLTIFVGLPQCFGNAIIQILIKVAVSEDQELLHLRIQENQGLMDSTHEEVLRILDILIDCSSSNGPKNVKSLYHLLDINPILMIHPKCLMKDCQNVLYDIVS